MVLKLYRRLQRGVGLELEIGRFLAEVNFSNTPALLGSVELVARDGKSSRHRHSTTFRGKSGGRLVVDARYAQARTRACGARRGSTPLDQAFATYWPYVQLLGRRTAELHATFASSKDPDFGAEPLTITDLKIVAADARRQADRLFGL